MRTLWSPFHVLDTRRDLALSPLLSLFDGFDRDLRATRGRRPSPRFVVTPEEAEWTVTADVPGLSKDDVTITLDDQTLTVRGARAVGAPEGYSASRVERSGFDFERSFTLPPAVDPDRIGATVSDGVLTITLGKRDAARPRTIAIEAR